MSAPCRVVLLGFMAAGKTSVGRALADLLGWRFLDVDNEIERRAGRTIPEIFRSDGEAAFRALEAEVAARLVERREVVVAMGGGWLDVDGLPEETLTVWLRISPEEAVRRASAAEAAERPMLGGGDPLERARRLLAAREPAYRRAALRLEAEAASPEELARAIAQAVHGAAPDRTSKEG